MAKSIKETTEKFTIYLPVELSQKIKDLAHFYRKNISDLFKDLAQDYAAKNEHALKIFHDAIKQVEQENQAN